MKLLLFILALILITGCGRPEIKNPEDIVSTDAKAVLYSPSLESIFKALPQELSIYSNVLYAFAEKDKPIALVLTALDPVEAYIAIPAKKGFEEELQKEIRNRLSLESEFWSGYVFVVIKGSIPSSFGNKDFLPNNSGDAIFGMAEIGSLLSENEEKLEDFKDYKTLRVFRNLLSVADNRILSRFVTHDLMDFLKQVDEVNFSLNEAGLSFDFKLSPDSIYSKNLNSMSILTLPKLPQLKDSDLEFSSSVDLSKVDFPLKGIERGFKSYLAHINKTESIFPMDTVFEKLRLSGNVQTVGAFSTDENSIGGEVIIQADKGKVLHEAFSKFCKNTTAILFVDWEIGGDQELVTEAGFRDFVFFGRNFDSASKVMANEKQVSLYYPKLGKNTINLKSSGEKGLFKAALKTKNFWTIDVGIKSIDIKLSVEENVLKFKADINENSVYR